MLVSTLLKHKTQSSIVTILFVLLSAEGAYASDDEQQPEWHPEFTQTSVAYNPTASWSEDRHMVMDLSRDIMPAPVLSRQLSPPLSARSYLESAGHSMGDHSDDEDCGYGIRNVSRYLNAFDSTPLAAGGCPPPDPDVMFDPNYLDRLQFPSLFSPVETIPQHRQWIFDYAALHHVDLYTAFRYNRIAEEIAQLLRGAHRPNQPVDRENVERSDRHARARQAVEAIYRATAGQDLDESAIVAEVVCYLETLNAPGQLERYRRVNLDPSQDCHMNEVNNALRTICGERLHRTDFASINDGGLYLVLADGTNMTVKGLLARVWFLIKQRDGDEQALLKHSLVRALGQCIEDDNHRVCSNGKTQRLVTVLQGYLNGIAMDDTDDVPTVNVFMKAFLDPKQASIKAISEKDDETRLMFAKELFKEAVEAARQTYGGSETYMEKVKTDLKTFCELTLLIEVPLEQEGMVAIPVEPTSSNSPWGEEIMGEFRRIYDMGGLRALARYLEDEDDIISAYQDRDEEVILATARRFTSMPIVSSLSIPILRNLLEIRDLNFELNPVELSPRVFDLHLDLDSFLSVESPEIGPTSDGNNDTDNNPKDTDEIE
jgi:hypothetical protein